MSPDTQNGAKSVIIFYGECLSSFLLYEQFLRKHPELIAGMVCFPVIPQKKDLLATVRSPLIKRILSASPAFLLFNFWVITIYNAIAMLFRARLRDIARRNGIPVYDRNAIDASLLDELKAMAPAWILNNSANILKKELLMVPSMGVLNFHCAPLPQYRGAANTFWMIHDGERHAKATLHYVETGLDTGPVIMSSKEIPITPGMSVFRLWYALRMEGYPCWESLIGYFNEPHAIPAHPQVEAAAVTRSFPSGAVLKAIRQRGHSLLTLKDMLTIVRIASRGMSRE